MNRPQKANERLGFLWDDIVDGPSRKREDVRVNKFVLLRIAVLTYALFVAFSPLAAPRNRLAALKQSVHPRAQAQFDHGPADPSFHIPYITLMLKPSSGQQAALERLLEEQQDRSSSNYHRWLSPEQFSDRFGLGRSDYGAIVAWVEAQGLHVEAVARARNWLSFSGSARQVESAFHTQIHRYVVEGESHFANATDVWIPAAFDNLVSGIRGLDDFWNTSGPVGPDFTTPNGAHQLAPDDWATIYDVSPLYSMGIDGTGQRVAIIGRSAIRPADIDRFRGMFGLPPTVIEQHLVGPEPGFTNAATEASLDLEWSGAIARNATLVYVYANIFDVAVQGAVDQNLAPVMSESFGTCEQVSAIANRSLAQQAIAQGITFVASSMDSGPASCDPHGFFGSTGGGVASQGLAVGIPAAFPEVTAVGGTQFSEGDGQYWSGANNANGGSALSYIPEVVWNQSGAPGLLASGGGPSSYFLKPAWQTGPGVPDDNARDIPDISFSASGFPHDPYLIVNNGAQTSSGGTSAGAPAFAGVVALLNQYVVSQGFQAQPGLGNINPALYRLARLTTDVFHDITQGSNSVACTVGSPGCSTGSFGYNAGPGYDLATGLGSIDVYNLLMEWNTPATATTTALVAGPASINLGDPVQLTATVTPVASSVSAVPTGTVTFVTGRTILGIATLANSGGVASATLNVTGPLLPVGSAGVTATYGGDSTFDGSTGSLVVNVAAVSTGSVVVISISPNPAIEGQVVKVTLTEVAGVATRVTGWTINGIDTFSRFVTDFRSDMLPAYGTLSSSLVTVTGVPAPASRVYVFTGVDADGRTWSQQYTLTLVDSASTTRSQSPSPAVRGTFALHRKAPR